MGSTTVHENTVQRRMEPLAKLTEEQKRRQAAKHALRSALETETGGRRRCERDERRKREGTPLSWADYMAGRRAPPERFTGQADP